MPAKEFYRDEDSLFERFAIMTIDGNLSDEEALEYLRYKTSESLYEWLTLKAKGNKQCKKT